MMRNKQINNPDNDLKTTVKVKNWGNVIIGKPINKPPTLLKEIDFTPGGKSDGQVCVFNGQIFDLQTRELKCGKILTRFNLTDYTGSVTAKILTDLKNVDIKSDIFVKAEGILSNDELSGELIFYPENIALSREPIRTDNETVKRVERHLHSQYSSMDAVSKVDQIMKQAAIFGHDMIGITDHDVLQAYPEMMALGQKYRIKVLYGLEASLVDDSQNGNNYPLYHVIVYARNQAGIKDLYRMVSESYLLHGTLRLHLPKSLLQINRKNLLIGSAGATGELFHGLLKNDSRQKVFKIASFYDYFEIQPHGNNMQLIDDGCFPDVETLINLNQQVIELGRILEKLVVATGDVHYKNKEDSLCREIMFTATGYSQRELPLYFRSTREMLEEFAYLGEETARTIVIDNTRKLGEMIDAVQPLPLVSSFPEIEDADAKLKELVAIQAKKRYGEPLPALIEKRLNQELKAIIKNGETLLYLNFQKLTEHFTKNKCLTTSKSSSLVAMLCGITEINPLPLHYHCSKCKNTEFFSSLNAKIGLDLKDKRCPHCGNGMMKDGLDIPFEIVFGFDGDKKPVITLNISGESQKEAFHMSEALFGKGKVYLAGKIPTISCKAAYGYVKKYFAKRGKVMPRAEIERLVDCCAGIKKDSIPKPGSMMVVPASRNIYDFGPVQRLSDEVVHHPLMAHFDSESISKNLLSLGFDDQHALTMLQRLYDLTGVDPQQIPIDEQKTLSLFTSTNALDLLDTCFDGTTGVCGVPGFKSRFVEAMLLEFRPDCFSDLIRIFSLSHGQNVWLNNAQELIKNNEATIRNVICTSEDIYIYLTGMKLEPKSAFNIMESVQNGKGLIPAWEKAMRQNDIPDWYIDSCRKINHLLSKTEAVGNVMIAFRIAWYKIYYPQEFYTAYFNLYAGEEEIQLIGEGKETVVQKINEIQHLRLRADYQHKLVVLVLANEMLCRGFELENVITNALDDGSYRIIKKFND